MTAPRFSQTGTRIPDKLPYGIIFLASAYDISKHPHFLCRFERSIFYLLALSTENSRSSVFLPGDSFWEIFLRFANAPLPPLCLFHRAQEVKEHIFFRGVDWQQVYLQKVLCLEPHTGHHHRCAPSWSPLPGSTPPAPPRARAPPPRLP